MIKREIRALTGLRGIAASWVVFHHLHEDDPLSGILSQILIHGYLAVDVFFVLSGFVMALSYKHLFENGFTGRAYGVFLGRRFARIWPLYAVATLGYAAIYAVSSIHGVVYHHITLGDLPYLIPLNLALVQTWGLGETLGGPAWSISTEFAAYLLFPLLASLALFSRPLLAFVTGVLALILMLVLPILTGEGYGTPRPLDLFDYHTAWPLVRCIAEFTLGIVAFRAATGGLIPSEFRSPLSACVVALAMVALTGIHHSDLAFVALSPILIVLLSRDEGPVAKVLGSRPIHFLGVVSYGMYLVHYALLHLHVVSRFIASRIGQQSADVVADLVVFGVVVLAAYVGYRLIELPGRSAVKRIIGRMEPATTRAVVAGERAGFVEAAGRASRRQEK